MQTHNNTMEVCSTVTTKKLSNLVKLILFTIQKLSDPHLLAKRTKTLRKSLNEAVSISHSHVTCRQEDVSSSYISPIQLNYEFSCSSTPPRRSYTTGRRSSNGSNNNKPLINKRQRQAYIRYNTLPKVRDSIWDRRHVAAATVFPEVDSSSGTVDICQVDRAAEEFIQRFYRQQRLQKWMMA